MVVLLADVAQAQTAERLRVESGAPGVGIGLCVGAECRVEVAGLREVGGAPVQSSDAWHLGSIGKSMTAVLAARLVERGQVSWEEIGPLLQHRAGYPANLSWLQRVRYSGERAEPMADRAAIAARAKPGAQGDYLYSNLGYIMAGHLIEQRHGAPYESLLHSELFGPLNLPSAGFGPPPTIKGHRRTLFGALRPMPADPRSDNIQAMAPAGKMHIALPDLLTYLRAHRDHDPLLSQATWQRLHAGVVGDYAMGWQVTQEGLAHDGSNTFWYAAVFVWPEWDAVLAITTNAPYEERVYFAVRDAAARVGNALRAGEGISALSP
ncbi:MAG: serine hydrolase domain-containing protein [Pseudomonadota bacterium]